MPLQEEAKSKQPEIRDAPTFLEEELMVAPLSIPTKRLAASRIDPPLSESGDSALEVALLAFRKRAATSKPQPEECDIEIKPLTIREVASNTTTPRPTTAASSSKRPSTPIEAESTRLCLLPADVPFVPQRSSPRSIVFKEESSPGIVNRRLQTGDSTHATPFDDSKNEAAPISRLSNRVPRENTGINPNLLRVPYTTGRASDFWYRNVIALPIIGESGGAVDSWEEWMADDQSLRPSPLRTIKMMEESEEAVGTPSNTAIPPADENPIAADLTPSSEVSGTQGDDAKQPEEERTGNREWRRIQETGGEPYPEHDPFLKPVPAEDGLQKAPQTGATPMTLEMPGPPPLMEDADVLAERGRLARERIRERETGRTELGARDKKIDSDADKLAPEIRAWEVFAADPQNQGSECVRKATAMYDAMQQTISAQMAVAHGAAAMRINAEVKIVELKNQLAARGGKHFVLREDSQKTVDKLSAQIERGNENMVQEDHQTGFWKAEAQKAASNFERLDKIFKEQEDDISELKMKLKDLHDETAGQRKQVTELKRDLAADKKYHDTMKQRNKLLIVEHEANLEKLARGHKIEVEEKDRQIEGLTERLKKRDAALKECHEEMKGLRVAASEKASDEQAKRNLQAKDKRIAELESKLTKAEGSDENTRSALNTVLKKNYEQKEDLEQLHDLRIKVVRQAETIAQLQEVIVDHHHEVTDLRQEKSRIDDEWNIKHKHALDDEGYRRNEMKIETEHLRVSLGDAEQRHRIATNEHQSLGRSLEGLEEKYKKLKKESEEHSRTVEVLTNTKELYQSRFKRCKEEKALLTTELDRQTSKLENLEEKNRLGCQAIRQKEEQLEARETDTQPHEQITVLQRSLARASSGQDEELVGRTRALEQVVIDLKQKILEYEEKGRILLAENERLNRLHKAVKEDNEKIRLQYEESWKISAELNEDNAKIRGMCDELSKKYQKIEQDALKFFEDRDKIFEEKNEAIRLAEEHIRFLEDSLAETSSTLADREEALRMATEEMQFQNDEYAETEDVIRALEEDLKFWKNQHASLSRRLAEYENDDLIVQLEVDLAQAKETEKSLRDYSAEIKGKLDNCEEHRKGLNDEINVLKDEIGRSAPNAFSPPRRTGTQSTAGFSHRSSRDGIRSPQSSLQSPPSTGGNLARAEAPTYRRGPQTPLAQIVTQARSPASGGARISNASMASMASSSPKDYSGPQPHPASIEVAIIRTELALRQMRNERAQHGFHHRDSLAVRNAAGDVRAAAVLLPKDKEREATIKDHYMAQGAYYLGVSYYYQDEVQIARGWFEEVEKSDSGFYPPEMIENWKERCRTQGPPKQASYYKDPPYQSGLANGKGKGPVGRKPLRRGSDKVPKTHRRTDDDDEDNPAGGRSGTGSSWVGSPPKASDNIRKEPSNKEDNNDRSQLSKGRKLNIQQKSPKASAAIFQTP